MKTEKRSYDTGGSRFTGITRDVEKFAAAAGEDGVVHVFVPHATAGLALMETGSGSERDLEEVLERLLPRDDHWVHSHGSTGHGADHLLPVLVSPSLSVPVVGGRPSLGTWQHLVLLDLNEDITQRKLRLSFLPG